MIIGIDKGHAIYGVRGASAILDEVDMNRAVGNRLIEMLKERGHTVVDCSVDESYDVYEQLQGISNKANAQSLDLFVSIHLNSSNGNGHGTEVFVYSGNYPNKEDDIATAGRVLGELVGYCGFRNRGVKQDNFYVLRETVSPAILIEICFVDSQIDADLFNTEKVAKAIYKGITGQNYIINPTVAPSTPKPSNPVDNITYRVVAGSYKDKGNAEKQVAEVTAKGFNCFIAYHEGYYRVCVGSYRNKNNANDQVVKLSDKGISSFITAVKL